MTFSAFAPTFHGLSIEVLSARFPAWSADRSLPSFLLHPLGLVRIGGRERLVVQTPVGADLLRSFQEVWPCSPDGLLERSIAASTDVLQQIDLPSLIHSYREELSNHRRSWECQPRSSRGNYCVPDGVDLHSELRDFIRRMGCDLDWEPALGDVMPLLDGIGSESSYACGNFLGALLHGRSFSSALCDLSRADSVSVTERLLEEWGVRLDLMQRHG